MAQHKLGSSVARNPSLQFEFLEPRHVMATGLGGQLLGAATTDPRATGGGLEPEQADIDRVADLNYIHDTLGLTGAGQTVVVIDSGIAYDHYALGGGFGEGYRVVSGWDFTEENDADPYDDAPGGFHGTHVAGIIGSSDTTYSGVASGVDLVALRVFNDQ